jgi:hypothetical protein
MNKTKKIFAILLVCSTTVVTSMAFAATTTSLSASISCPDIGAKGKGKVSNSGTVLSGEGSERFRLGDGSASPTKYPLFSSVTPAGVPLDLVAGGYANSSTAYNPSTNLVTCNFTSSLGHPPFHVTHTLQNITNGVVTSSGAEEIIIKFAIGLRNKI